jgi:hypothetical protein
MVSTSSGVSIWRGGEKKRCARKVGTIAERITVVMRTEN